MESEVLVTARGQYVADDWLPVTRGVRRHAQAPDAFAATLAAWLAVLPSGACFTHLTAARLHGWWLPPLPDDLPVFVALPPGSHRVRRPGLVTLRRKEPTTPEWMGGLPVEPAMTILATCARDLGVLDLVCLVDAALATGQMDPAVLGGAGVRGARGVSRLRRAIELSDPRAESIYEVLLRVLHVVCEVPVEPQFEVRDEAGGVVARGDLHLIGTRTLHEYDGGEHLTRPGQRKDLKRDRRLGHVGWSRRGYTREDVLFQAPTILRDADASIGRDHEPSRIRAWHALMRESLFTPAGTARLAETLGLGGRLTRAASR
ncbi:hypothetical protein [Nocardioides sp. AE5]|uniref:hypothetical protein n=1 Tax=Nocardioides sp. AE5 TaxID=2962573 RepID=UPI00288189A9|nr:hypothetical protein [Nocardioides sp. AE5]MDT0201814.1 hypothetical protein [Nocardioides sp. AE5]